MKVTKFEDTLTVKVETDADVSDEDGKAIAVAVADAFNLAGITSGTVNVEHKEG